MSDKASKQPKKKMSEKSFTDGKSKEHDKTCQDLIDRYSMDPKIWDASKRGFPYNIPLNAIVYSSLGVPLLFGLYMIKFDDPHFLKLYVPTIIISFIGYKLTSSLIVQFKDKLVENGRFGKDLNKAGAKEDKPPV